jgi:hypothetical protein
MSRIVFETKEYMILDKSFFFSLRDEIYDKLSLKYKDEKGYRTTYKKKLGYLVETTSKELLRLNFKDLPLKDIYMYLYMFLLKKGANYLRQDSLQSLICALDDLKKVGELTDIELKGKIYFLNLF